MRHKPQRLCGHLRREFPLEGLRCAKMGCSHHANICFVWRIGFQGCSSALLGAASSVAQSAAGCQAPWKPRERSANLAEQSPKAVGRGIASANLAPPKKETLPPSWRKQRTRGAATWWEVPTTSGKGRNPRQERFRQLGGSNPVGSSHRVPANPATKLPYSPAAAPAR